MKIIRTENKKTEISLEIACCHQTVINWSFFLQNKEKALK